MGNLRRLVMILILLAVAGSALPALDPGLQALFRERYQNRSCRLRIDLPADPTRVSVDVDGNIRVPARVDSPLIAAGRIVRVRSMEFRPTALSLRLTATEATRTVLVLVNLPPGEAEGPTPDATVEAALAAVLTPLAVQRAPETETEPPPKPDRPEETAETTDDEETVDNSSDQPPAADTVRLLVEPGRDALKGDGDDTVTVTVTARDGDGRLLTECNGAVAVRASAGRLSAATVPMRSGTARVNLQAPILDDDSTVFLRSIQLTYVVIQGLIGSKGANPVETARKAALNGPNVSSLSTVKGDKPWVFLVAEFQGVKGRAKVKVVAAPRSVGTINGYYTGKDITGSTKWTYETTGPGKGILKQVPSRDEIPVQWTGESHMGFYGVDVGGIGTSAVPLPGDTFYLIAPPILFHRAAAATTTPGSAPVEEPKPTVTLVAGKNPIAADGESETRIVFQYLDPAGRPRRGVTLKWQLDRLGLFGPKGKGRLVSTEAVTDGAGQARAVYRAPSMEAADMQQTGSIKNRDVNVEYSAGDDSGTVRCEIGLMKAAPVQLVVEKPGVEKSMLPVRIGSLNGTITGQVLLKVTKYRMPGMPATLPLANARVRLDGDPKILKWAAVDEAITDDEGRFTIRMKMSNWPPWDKDFKQPFQVLPSARFLALQHNCLLHLDQWPRSREMAISAREEILRGQKFLAELEADEAQGLTDKLEVMGWMLLVLKDARKDGKESAMEFLGHAGSLLKATASFFFADSRLDKYLRQKYKSLEGAVGVRKLKFLNAKLKRRIGQSAPAIQRIANYLSTWLLKSKSGLSDDHAGAAARFARGSLDKLIIPQMLKVIAGELAKFSPKSPFPNIPNLLSDRMLQPFEETANKDLAIFVANRDYLAIHRAAIPAYARLKAYDSRLATDFLRVTHWRIAEMYAQTFIDTASECSQVGLKILGFALLQPELVQLAGKIETAQKWLDNGMAGAKFFEEWYRLAGILSRSEAVVLTCVAETSGHPLPANLQAGGRPLSAGQFPDFMQAGMLPSFGEEDLPDLDMEDLLDGLAPDGTKQVTTDDLVVLLAAEEVQGAWQQEALPALLALGDTDRARTQRYAVAAEAWTRSLRMARQLAVVSLDRPLDENQLGAWRQAVTELRSASNRYQEILDETRTAIAELPEAPAEQMRVVLAAETGGSAPWRKRMVMGSVVGLIVLGTFVVLWFWIRRRRRVVPVTSRAMTAPGPAGFQSPAVAPPAFSQPVPTPSPPAAPPPLGPCLQSPSGHSVSLNRQCTTIGAAPDNDLSLTLDGISRYHARVWRTDDGRFWIEDLGSTNGVTVNGRRVAKEWLLPGGTVYLGQWSLTFRPGPPPPPR